MEQEKIIIEKEETINKVVDIVNKSDRQVMLKDVVGLFLSNIHQAEKVSPSYIKNMKEIGEEKYELLLSQLFVGFCFTLFQFSYTKEEVMEVVDEVSKEGLN